jgi:hypothetical protein
VRRPAAAADAPSMGYRLVIPALLGLAVVAGAIALLAIR